MLKVYFLGYYANIKGSTAKSRLKPAIKNSFNILLSFGLGNTSSITATSAETLKKKFKRYYYISKFFYSRIYSRRYSRRL